MSYSLKVMGLEFKINTAYQNTTTTNQPQKKHQLNNEITASYITRSLCEVKKLVISRQTKVTNKLPFSVFMTPLFTFWTLDPIFFWKIFVWFGIKNTMNLIFWVLIVCDIFFIYFYLYIYPPDLQESAGGANT